MKEAATLNQRNMEAFSLPFPQAPDRGLSHDQCRPRPIVLTAEGAVEGELSWLIGATIALRFTRSLLAPYDAREGGPCDDPASLFGLELAGRWESDPDAASFCADLRQPEKGRRDRARAGVHAAIPGEDDLRYGRRRVGAAAIEAALAVFVGLFRAFGLIKGDRLATDGQLEPAHSRFQGCAYCGQACQTLPLDAASRDERARQLQAGAKRLASRGPFPEVVPTVLPATTTQGKPREPRVALLASESGPTDRPQAGGHLQLSELLALPPDPLPPRRLQWSHLTKGPQGELWGRCPQGPADLEATVGDHIDTQDPHQPARVFGYLQHKTTNLDVELGVAWPVGLSTYPAHAPAGSHFQAHRAKGAIPVRSQPSELADAGYDAVEHYPGSRSRGGIPLMASNPRRADLSPEALVARGDDPYGTPYAPCGRLCCSNGYDYLSDSRQSVCGLPCPRQAREQCPHGRKVRGYPHRMACPEYPRLIGPIQRGTADWKLLYAARTASERTHSDDHEVIAHGRPRQLRGLQALRCAGAIRTVAHLLRRALPCGLAVTSTLGKLPLART